MSTLIWKPQQLQINTPPKPNSDCVQFNMINVIHHKDNDKYTLNELGNTVNFQNVL